MFKPDDEGNLTAEPKDGLEKYGLIEFKERAVVLVNALPSSGEPNKTHEVFGVFSNEGGSVVFKNGGDIIAKGRDNHHLVSAIAVASTYGVLDPLKLGTVTVQATSGLNRIWGWSDNFTSAETSEGDNTYKVVNNDSLFDDQNGTLNQDIFEDLDTNYENYLSNARIGTTTQTLRSAVIAANGAEVTLTDTDGGYFDIRGDIVSGLKNGEDAESNTFNKSGASEGGVDVVKDMSGTVTRASVTINLSNPNSTLVGNVYERHRVSGSEAVKAPDLDDAPNGTGLDADSQSFTAWQQAQYEKEAASLGGSVELTLAGGATWYPTKDWGGWNFDILYNGFISTNQDGGYTINKDYELYDAADQYNLHVWNDKGGGYQLANSSEISPLGLDGTSTKINDLDLLDEASPLSESEDPSIPYANGIDKRGFKAVDNGIYHLALDGGVVDLYYLRHDFAMSTEQGDLGTAASVDSGTPAQLDATEESDPLAGEKRFRIQALSGDRGTIRMYAADRDNHDIVIVDERRDPNNEKLTEGTTNINLEFWNTQGPTDLGVKEGDASTYIHVARVPENVTITANSYGFGRTTYTSYRVEADKKEADGTYGEDSWTWIQGQDWHVQNVNWFVTSNGENKADLAVIGTTEAAANLGYMMATTVETLRDRRGEMRFNGTQEDGWWVRYTHNNFGMSGLSAETDGFQMGYEYEAARDEDGRTFRGFAIDAAQGDVEYSTMSGQSKADRYRASVYQTYVADDGFYYDLIGRAGWYDAETNMLFRRDSEATLYNVKGDFDYWAAALSFETGKRWESDSAWWFEPEVQLQYTFIDGYDYGSSQGIQVDADSTHSLIGRLGLRAGKVFTNEAGRKMNIWIGADALHEWLGDREGSMKGVDQTIDYSVSGDDTWYNAVLGLTWETGADSRIWTTAKHTLGGEKDDCWSVNLGATWNF